MGRNLMAQVSKYLSSYKRKQIGYWVLCSLAAVVVFCTTYALILPAITMSNDPICGFEAHVHDDSCWSTEMVAPEAELICEELWRDAGVVFHTHSELCYNSEGGLICPLDEREPHIHEESCFVEAKRELICELAGDPATEDGAPAEPGENALPSVPNMDAPQPGMFHVHTEDCYSYERGGLICHQDAEGHRHDDSCYTDVPSGEMVIICGQEEFPGHWHTDSCYETAPEELICGQMEWPGHWHNDSCYWIDEFTGEWTLICGQEESGGHVHGPDCYTSGESWLACGQEETEGHWHTNACFQSALLPPVLTCGKEEAAGHVQDDNCYERIEVLTCAQEESGADPAGLYAAPGDLYGAPEEPGMFQNPEEEGKHVHTDERYEITLIPVCGEEELELHTHGPECYETILVDDGEGGFAQQEILICELPVVIEHQHTEACLFQPEGEGREIEVRACGLVAHVHDDTCYVEIGPSRDPYFCGMDEHIHTEECYFESGELRCTMPEHIHMDKCREPDSAPETEYPLFSTEDGETEYACGLRQHTHDGSCWMPGELICGQVDHVHSGTCWQDGVLICELNEHTHTDECRLEGGLVCGLEEHIHDEACLPEKDENGDSKQADP
ncbi:MAG: hypothetical protein K2N78_10535, partial [Oscillospiraceae bacterium]|nr:hypothetical protein [Oscillospiraceae bacterium]